MVYFQAENRKQKRTFVRKLLFWAPAVTVLMAGLSPVWFQITSYNWWYMFLSPGFLTLTCALIERRDGEKLKYQAILSLPVSLEKVWLAKIATAAFYYAMGNAIFLGFNLLGGLALKVTFDIPLAITVWQALSGTFVIVIVSMWQIPLCLWISLRWGLFVSVMINWALGCVLSIMTADAFWGKLCPYSWVPQLMIELLRIRPNGEPATAEDVGMPLLLMLFIVLIAVALFGILSIATAKHFEKRG